MRLCVNEGWLVLVQKPDYHRRGGTVYLTFLQLALIFAQQEKKLVWLHGSRCAGVFCVVERLTLTQFTQAPSISSVKGLGLQIAAHPGQASCEFVEVDCSAGPQPFQFNFFQASQQELSEAKDMFDHSERCLGDPHALIVFLFGGVFSHLGRKFVALRSMCVSTDGTPPFVGLSDTASLQRAIAAVVAAVGVPCRLLTSRRF